MIWEPVATGDLICLRQQLQREPRHLAGIARRCAQGFPAVLVNVPLPRMSGDELFFPTLFWLSCPAAVKAVGRLEDEGWIARLQHRASQEAELHEALENAHRGYIALRSACIAKSEADQLALRHPRLVEALSRRGIGGVLDWGTLKCLHMHYAHFLATGDNPIGAWVETRWNLEEESTRCPGCAGKA